MKAMILAAGRGSRMGALTDSVPKPLLQVGEHALIVWQILALKRAGICEIVINHAYLGAQIEAALGDGTDYGVRITYSPEPPGGLETAGGIQKALPLLGDQPFLVTNADIFTSFNYQEAVNCQDTTLFFIENPSHNPTGDYAIIDRLLRPKTTDNVACCRTYSGIGVFHPHFFEELTPGFVKLKALIDEKLASNTPIHAQLIESKQWFDVGTPERLEQVRSIASQE